MSVCLSLKQRCELLAGASLVLVGLLAPGAGAQTRAAPGGPGYSSSIAGIPSPTPAHAASPEPQAVKTTTPPTPAENYYGASPPGTFTNTDQLAGPTSTLPPQTKSPRDALLENPNTVAATASGPVSNGTGQPLVDNSTVAVPAESISGEPENPQESYTALTWIVIGVIVIVGSIFGMIKTTQPGGVA